MLLNTGGGPSERGFRDCPEKRVERAVNEMQLTVWAKMIITGMKSGNMDRVAEIYGMVSEKASMEEAAKLEEIIASLSG
jgi:hypothetical protein